MAIFHSFLYVYQRVPMIPMTTIWWIFHIRLKKRGPIWALTKRQDQGPAPYAETLTSIFMAIADIVQETPFGWCIGGFLSNRLSQ